MNDNINGNIKYAFTYSFDLSNPLNINAVKFELNINDFANHSCELITRDEKVIKDTNLYQIVCNDFLSTDDAYIFSEKVITGIKWYGFKTGSVVLPFVEDNGAYVNSEYFSEKLGIIVIPAANLTVYDQTKKPFMLSSSCNVTAVRNNEDQLLKDFMVEYISNKSISKINLSLNIYNESKRQRNLDFKFLSLMIILEILAKQEDNDPKVIKFIDETIEQLPDLELETNSLNSLKSRIKEMKHISITETIRRLLREYTITSVDYKGNSIDSFISYCYKLRSEFVHDGEIKLKNGDSFKEIVNQLDRIIKELLKKINLSNYSH